MTKRRHVVSQHELPFGVDDAPPAVTPSHAVETLHASPLAASEAAAVREALSFCPRLFSALPAASTLVCQHAEVGRVLFTTSRQTYNERARAMAAFTGVELAAMSLAAEHDRGSPHAFVEWAARKARNGPTWRLTAAAALGPVVGRFESRGWMMGQVFERLGLALVVVHVHELDGDEVPALTGGGLSHAAE